MVRDFISDFNVDNAFAAADARDEFEALSEEERAEIEEANEIEIQTIFNNEFDNYYAAESYMAVREAAEIELAGAPF